jgi:hypothetical protein
MLCECRMGVVWCDVYALVRHCGNGKHADKQSKDVSRDRPQGQLQGTGGRGYAGGK